MFLTLGTMTGSTARADLTDMKKKAFSDDAASIEEAFFHGSARSFVIQNVVPNKLKVGGAEFRVKRNPVGKGCFVYDSGAPENKIVWWVIDEKTAYALNSPSKMVTPGLKWPRDDGLWAPSTSQIVNYVFDGTKIPAVPPPSSAAPSTNSFTVQDYKIYRAIIDTGSIPETKAVLNAAERYGVSAAAAKDSARKVQKALFQNRWYGSPESEIKHAVDWKDETP